MFSSSAILCLIIAYDKLTFVQRCAANRRSLRDVSLSFTNEKSLSEAAEVTGFRCFTFRKFRESSQFYCGKFILTPCERTSPSLYWAESASCPSFDPVKYVRRSISLIYRDGVFDFNKSAYCEHTLVARARDIKFPATRENKRGRGGIDGVGKRNLTIQCAPAVPAYKVYARISRAAKCAECSHLLST